MSMPWLQVFIGHDEREPEASRVALGTLAQNGVLGTLLVDRTLRDRGLLTRPIDRRGQMHDIISNAAQSTEFACSRFLTPILAGFKWALFVDADVVFMPGAIDALADAADPRYAVQVVMHNHQPTQLWKMDSQPQVPYGRKNWSSVMLFNTEHPGNRRLTLHDVNTRPGLYLHQFGWLADGEIGNLSAGFNWLVNEKPRPDQLNIAHFTNGGPFTPGWKGAPFDDLWLQARDSLDVRKDHP